MTSVTQKSTCSFFGLQNYIKFVLVEIQSYNWYQNNSTILHEITPLFDIPDSLFTMIGYVQPCFEP